MINNNQTGTVSDGFKNLIATLVHQRDQVQPIAVAPSKTELVALTITTDGKIGQVMSFRVWAKRWSDENIDGRRRI
jgi:hypothetical protein